MNELMLKLKDSEFKSLFTLKDLSKYNFEDSYLKQMLHELTGNEDIIHIKDDIYTLGNGYRKELISEEVFAQMIDPDSYVSMEYVLFLVSWIPESVYSVTSVTKGSSMELRTKLGLYEFISLPQKSYTAGVREYTDGIYRYKVAKPLKALADMIYERKYKWNTLYPVYNSLRIEPEFLEEELTGSDFDELHDTYGVKFVEDFLSGIRKELAL